MNFASTAASRGLRRLSACLFLVASMALIGCGEGGGGSVSGKVMYKGEAVKGGSLVFAPTGDSKTPGKPVATDVKADGSYSASGVVAGKNKVTYSAPVNDPGRELKPGEGPPPSPWDGLVPKQQDVDVKSGSTVDIELVRPGK
jgi:hypothetical protein